MRSSWEGHLIDALALLLGVGLVSQVVSATVLVCHDRTVGKPFYVALTQLIDRMDRWEQTYPAGSVPVIPEHKKWHHDAE